LAVFDAFDIAILGMAALTVPVLLVAIFLPAERRKKALRHLGRKWIV
jgi:hypothetical protein